MFSEKYRDGDWDKLFETVDAPMKHKAEIKTKIIEVQSRFNRRSDETNRHKALAMSDSPQHPLSASVKRLRKQRKNKFNVELTKSSDHKK